MNTNRIIEGIESKLDNESRHLRGSPYLYQAFFEVVYESEPGLSDDIKNARAAQRAKELARDNEEEESLELRQTPTDRIFGNAIVRALAPTIADLRERSEFKRPEPPFTSVAEAAAWVETRSTKDLEGWRAKSRQRNKAHDEIQRLVNKHGIEIRYESTLLPYQMSNNELDIKWTPVVPGTWLYRLAKETQRIAKHTGLPQDALVIHVLAGLSPVRSRARVTTRENHYTLPSGEQIHVNEAVVTFRARDLTDRELRGIYRTVKGHVGGKGTEALDDKDEHLWILVQDMGGPPQAHGTKGPFWQAVLEKLDLKYPGQITTRRGVEKRYDRILKRLQLPREARSNRRNVPASQWQQCGSNRV
jgi:hypothetical protein